MEIKLLDDILKYLLYIQRAEKPYVVGSNPVDSSFIKIDNNLFKSAILKLQKDDYIYFGNNVELKNITNLHIAGLIEISFDGIIFINQGGYHQALKEAQRKENVYDDLQTEQKKQAISLLRLNRWLVFGAIVVAIDSILNILIFFGVYFDTSNFLFCLKPT